MAVTQYMNLLLFSVENATYLHTFMGMIICKNEGGACATLICGRLPKEVKRIKSTVPLDFVCLFFWCRLY